MPPLPLLPFSTSRSAASAYHPANGKSFGQSRSVYAGSQGLPTSISCMKSTVN